MWQPLLLQADGRDVDLEELCCHVLWCYQCLDQWPEVLAWLQHHVPDQSGVGVYHDGIDKTHFTEERTG